MLFDKYVFDSCQEKLESITTSRPMGFFLDKFRVTSYKHF